MYIGIDLGFSKSVMSIFGKNQSDIITDEFGNQSIPSSFVITKDNQIITGRSAKQNIYRYQDDNTTFDTLKPLFDISNNFIKQNFNIYPQEILAHILLNLKRQARNYLNSKISGAVITIPSYLNEKQIQIILDAAKIAELDIIRLMNKATAVATYYSFKNKRTAKLVVIHFGSSIDISVIENDQDVCIVLSTEGSDSIGGNAFNKIILNDVQNKVKSNFEKKSIHNLILKEYIENIKIESSTKSNVNLHIPGFINTSKGYVDLEYILRREVLEKESTNLLNSVIKLIKSALRAADLKESDVNGFILLGSSSKLPFVKKIIAKEFNKIHFKNLQSLYLAAKGSSLIASIMEGNPATSDFLLLDSVSHSFGYSLDRKNYTVVIPKNSTIPLKRSKQIPISLSNTKTNNLYIYQGDNQIASENILIASINLQNNVLTPSKENCIVITFDFDIRSRMVVTVTNNDEPKRTIQISLNDLHKLNSEQMLIIKNRLNKLNKVL